MNIPQIPFNETARQKALDSYDIVDTLPEADYDDITRIAALICNTPIALITFIDKDRQYFKSKIGVTVNSTTRESAFCAHAINEPNNLMVVQDSRTDVRFENNELVTGDPHVIFYAGMPLVTPEGFALGTLCVIDNKPNKLNEQQQAALKSLSNQVCHLLELRKQNSLNVIYQNKLKEYALEMESFAYMASHDLKDPLRTIAIFMQKLQKNYGNKLDEKANEYLNYAVAASKKMTLLVNDLLEYAALDKEEIETEELNVNDTINYIIIINSFKFKELNPTIEFSNLPTIIFNKTAFKILLQNIIMNAIKFRKQNEALKIAIDVINENNCWIFKFKDNGVGISEKDLKEVFKPFKSIHSGNEVAGSGMGLAACKKIIEKQGGKIWIKSEINIGTELFFEILKK